MTQKKRARKPCRKVYTVYKRLNDCQGKSVGSGGVDRRDDFNQKITNLYWTEEVSWGGCWDLGPGGLRGRQHDPAGAIAGVPVSIPVHQLTKFETVFYCFGETVSVMGKMSDSRALWRASSRSLPVMSRRILRICPGKICRGSLIWSRLA